MFPATGWIEEHGYQSQAEDRGQGDVKLNRHRLKNQHRIPRAQAGVLEQARCLCRGGVKLSEGDCLDPAPTRCNEGGLVRPLRRLID